MGRLLKTKVQPCSSTWWRGSVLAKGRAMNRRNPRAKWTLPDVINPLETMCVQIQVPKERFHIAAFRGALLNLASAAQWADDPDHTAREVALVWRDVINSMTEVCDGLTGCRDVRPQAPLVGYEPQDPYTQPDFTPAGYLLPPFYIVTAGSIPNLLGFQVGDVLTDITRIPVGTGVITEPTSGWARFRVTVYGTGIVTLQLLNVPLGGYALVTEDDDPLSAVFVELNLDLIDLPPENNFIVGNEHRFTTEGEHHIDVTFLPRFNDEAPAVFWGGGIRIITICGFEDMMFDIRQKDGMPCIIEKTNNGVDWVDAVNMQKCPPKLRTNGGVIQWQDPDTDEWEDTETGDERDNGEAPTPYPDNPDGACLSAENITAFYQSNLTNIRADVALGKNVTAIAAGFTGAASLFMPVLLYGTIALSLSAAALALTEAGLDVMLETEHLDNFKCVVYCNAEDDGSITASAFTAIRDGMESWASGLELEIIQYYLDCFGSVGLQRQGAAMGVTTGHCEDCGCDGCQTVTFSGTPNYTLTEGFGTVIEGGGETGNALGIVNGQNGGCGIALFVTVDNAGCLATGVTVKVWADWGNDLLRTLQWWVYDPAHPEAPIADGEIPSTLTQRTWQTRHIDFGTTITSSELQLRLRTGAECQNGTFKVKPIIFTNS